MRRRDPKGRANRRRGEVEAVIGGERRILCLTLGALAELETAFAAETLADLAARFSGGRLKTLDLVRIIGAGLRGGGNLFSDEDVMCLDIEGGVQAAAEMVAALLSAAFGTPAGEGTSAAGEGAQPRP